MKTKLMTGAFVGLLALSVWAKFAWESEEQQFKEATHVVRAKALKRTDIKVEPGIIEYAFVEFEVLEDLKGVARGAGRGEGHPRVIHVVAQTEHDWACPSGPKFKEGEEYILFLKNSRQYLYTMVTDWQGDTPATKEALETVRGLK